MVRRGTNTPRLGSGKTTVATTNRTVYAILGLLAQGPKTGYAIKQVVEQTISHFWKESYGHLYPTLARLVDEGLVTQDAAGGRRGVKRQRYHLTDAGRETLSRWLAEPVVPEGVRNELALKLFFGELTTPAVCRRHLQAHREHHLSLLARFREDQREVEQRVAAGEPGARHELITLSLGLHISTARVAWCDEALRLLESAVEASDASGVLQ